MKLDKDSVLQEIIEQSLAGYWDFDISSWTAYFSPAFKKMLGYENIESDNSIEFWNKLIFEEDLPVISKKLNQHIKSNGKILFHIEVRYHHRNGSTVWVLSTGKIIEWDDNGNAQRMVGYNIDITERRRAEEELKIAHDKYHSLVENIPGIVYRCKYDDNWTMLYISDGVALLTGYDPCDLIHNATRTYESLIHPEDTASMTQKAKCAVSIKQPWDLEYRLVHKDGTIRWVHEKGRAVYNEKGGVEYLDGIILDITDRKHAEDLLRDKDDRLQKQNDALLALISHGTLFQVDLQHAIEEITETSSKLMGTERVSVWLYSSDYKNIHCVDLFNFTIQKHSSGEELSSEDFPAYTGSHCKGKVIAASDVFNDSYTCELPFSYYREHGISSLMDAPVWMHDRLGAILSFENVGKQRFWTIEDERLATNMAALLSLCFEVNERRQAEETLKARERRFAQLIQNSFDAIIILDSNGIQKYVSDAAERMHGFSPSELVNIHFIENMIHPDDREQVTSAFQKIIETGEGGAQYRHIHKSGGWVHLEARGTNQLDNPDINGIVLNVRDITERKHSEDILANTQKLESLGVLAGGIAHDFNNLMGGMYGYIEMALDSSTEDYVKRSLTKVMQTIERARDLTRQLLTFSKGGSPLLENASLFPHIKQTVQFALSGSNVSCCFDIQDDLWFVNYDKNQIGQVIDNLVINAQQAMPHGGTIDLSARNVSLSEDEHPILKQGDYVKISLTDTGVGIPKEIQKRIFDPFFTTKATGHGLGLATSYSIIRRHNGCINVYSEQGKGSTFSVYLPASKGTVKDPNDNTVRTHHGNGTFLIMDDEKIIRETISAMLESLGYTVVSTENGQEAIDYVEKSLKNNLPLDGMIFDLTIPGAMGGKETIAQIRKLGVKAPAFVASGYADYDIVKKPGEFGFTASICKPFMRKDLIEILEKHMKSNG